MLLKDITAPYGKLESYLYDALIAPAVTNMRDRLESALLPLLPEGAHLLDVGCGGGQNAIAIARRRPDVNITGVDLSPEQVERAISRSREFSGRVRFVVGSALDLPFANASFDAVLSVASLKHWPDKPRGLAECVRVLRPGGGLAVVEVDRGCRDEDVHRFIDEWRIIPFLRPGARIVFRNFVAGPSVDLDDARTLMAALPLDTYEVRRIPETPGILMMGRARQA